MADYPYFPFYPADWLSSPRVMCSTLAQQGAYIRLLSACWLSGDCSLPADSKQLSMLSGLLEHELEFVRGFFVEHPNKPGALTNERLFSEWEKVTRLSAVRSQAARKSVKSRRAFAPVLLKQTTSKLQACTPISESESESEVRSQKQIKNKKNTCAQPSVVAVVATRFADAYRTRYKTDPVRNARVYAQLSQLVKRIGQEAAPEVAAFYVRHNDQFYVRARHSVGLLLRDAEGLHTQWKTGQLVTSAQARKIDETQGRVNVFQELINERRMEVCDVGTA